ncbi:MULTISPECIES: tetratricopeptide repeat protein [Robiginitalea]|uniref:tetratricopeptide repeat protein n=1 Tax=Robiginitalea TaxID=252306 RepID=UPI00031EDAFB|nr:MULTISPECIES: tetratricopeptide repeat protein [Robiginitalea]MDC6353744.1 tetratricopeptide repeat protein [Robiginitalea sp. PM2]MDC6375818.1 tetratricopeptide repeat protein [Robiginitalea sp. SP8]
MKTRLTLLAALLIGSAAIAQKSEIRDAEKALKDGNTAEAKASLDAVQGVIAGEDERLQSEYHLVRGQVYADLAKKGDDSAFEEAVASFRKVLEVEEQSGKDRNSGEAQQRLKAMSADLVNSAVDDNNAKNFDAAAEKLYMSYKISPTDTIYLYYAASSAVNGGNYERAMDFYQELKDIGYDGSGVVYKATNVETGEVEEMNKAQRDLMVKSGTYTDPVDEKEPSKKAEIVKNMALIYTQLGENEKALEAYKDARANNPDDVNLVLNEANLYYQMGDKEKFSELMAEAATMAPDNPDLYYNIGVINMEMDRIEEAREAYRKAIEINPGYVNAQLNLSTTYVNEGNALIDDMNALGTSREDIAKYDELKEKKDSLFMQGAEILEDALKVNPDNQSILTQLKNIYGALGDNENFMRVKKLLGE